MYSAAPHDDDECWNNNNNDISVFNIKWMLSNKRNYI
jgi:hypothetical protein